VDELERERNTLTSGPRHPLQLPADHYQLLYEHTPAMSFALTPEGTILSVNRFGADQLGYLPEDLTGRSVLLVFDPTDHQTVREQLTLCARSPYKIFQWEIRKVHRSGHRLWVRETARSVQDDQGNLIVLVMCEDITKHKQAEEALQESEVRFRQIAETIEEVVWSADPAIGKMLYISPAYERVWGRTCASLYEHPKSFIEAIHPDDRERILTDLAVQRYGFPFAHEYRVVRPDGVIRWVWDRGFPVRDLETGQPTHYVGVALDITERKQAEQDLRLVRERLQYLLATNPSVIYTCNISGDYGATYVSDNIVDQMGYEPHDFIDDPAFWVSHIHPDDRTRVLTAVRRIFEEGSHADEYRFLHKDGTYRWMHDRLKLVCNPSGQPVEIIGSWIDITDRKQAEAALRLTKFSIEHAVDAVFWVDAEARILDINEAACSALGYTREELLTMTVPDIDPNFPSDSWPAHWAELKARGSFSFETAHRKKDGTIIQTETTVNFLVHEGKEYNCAFMRDITARKQAEAQLHLTQFAVNQAGDLIFWISQDASLLYVNEAAARRLGYSQEELCRLKVADIDPDHQLHNWATHWEELRRSRRLRFETRHRTKSGEVYPVEVVANFVMVDGNEYNFAFARDISERKAAEEALRQSEQEVRQAFEERERLSQDLHDNLLQSLYAVGMGLDLTKQRIKRGSPVNAKRLENSVAELNAVIREVRTFIPRMHAPTHETKNVVDTLRSLVNSFVATGTGNVALTIDPNAASQLSPEQSAHILAIAKEALSNSLRHTKAANRSITLALYRGRVRLEVADDGEGFQLRKRRPHGMGIKNMRARAATLNSRLAIRTALKKGTRITLDLPQLS